MSKSISMLSTRLDKLQQNRGSDNNQNKTSFRPVALEVTKTPAAKSNNEEFAAVTKCLYRIVQLYHHQANWKTLPDSITHQIKHLMDNIKPPAPDDAFRKGMSDLTTEFGEKIREIVSQHLQKKLITTEIIAGQMNPTDLDRAKEIAMKYIDTRIGKRLPQPRKAFLLNRATNMIGARKPPPPAPSADDTTWKTVNSSGVKRPAPITPETVEVSNRYLVLSDNDDTDLEPDDDPVPRATTPSRHQMKKRKQSAFSKKTPSGVQVFNGNKHDWTIIPNDETTTVVIGDSNLRNITNIPKNWEVHSLPGARLNHVVGAIARMETVARTVDVVVHVGINHRSCVDPTIDEELKDLSSELNSNLGITRLFITGTAIAPSLPPQEAHNIRNLNDKMKEFFHESNYIPPLADSDVEIDPRDNSGIHYTSITADKIMTEMEKYVDQSVFH